MNIEYYFRLRKMFLEPEKTGDRDYMKRVLCVQAWCDLRGIRSRRGWLAQGYANHPELQIYWKRTHIYLFICRPSKLNTGSLGVCRAQSSPSVRLCSRLPAFFLLLLPQTGIAGSLWHFHPDTARICFLIYGTSSGPVASSSAPNQASCPKNPLNFRQH